MAALTIALEVSIRPVRESDLVDLPWDSEAVLRPGYVRERLRQHGEEVTFLAAFANGAPVGRLGIDFGQKAAEAVVVLWSFAVLPSLQRLGIGTALIGAAETIAAARGARTSEIGVETWNRDARRLYERLGYRLAGEEPGDRGEKIVLLRRSLSPTTG
jgi:ribosomal protein S18 acetylase RimI-like enzyme